MKPFLDNKSYIGVNLCMLFPITIVFRLSA